MLQNIHSWSKTWFLRIILGILFGLLILSFAIWGIGDIFRQSSQRSIVAEVGEIEILEDDFVDELRREIDRLQEGTDAQIDLRQALDMGIADRVLDRMVFRALYDLAARDAGVAVSDQVMRAEIIRNPSFQNSLGEFDPEVFQQTLFRSGYSEDRFVALMRGDLVRGQVTAAVTDGATAPKLLVDLLYRFRAEKRVAETVRITDAAVRLADAPTEEELEAYHKEHADRYMAAEFREVTAVILMPEDILDQIEIDDAALREEYESRADEFQIPERRVVEQMLFDDEATARKAHDRLKLGEDFAAVAKEMTGAAPIDLGKLTREDFIIDTLGEVSFGLSEDGFSEPVRTDLGWHILHVTEVEPAYTEGFGVAREKLAKEIKRERSVDVLFDLANKFEDELGGGASLEEAASRLNVKVVKIPAVDRQGNDRDGKKIDVIPEGPEFLDTVFFLSEGEDSRMTESQSGAYFALRVDKITPASVRPLAEVRDRVIADWETDRRHAIAKERAAALLERVEGGEDMAVVAKEAGYSYEVTAPFTRDGRGLEPGFPLALVGEIFKANRGDAFTAPTDRGYVVARLKEILPANPAAATDEVNSLAAQLRSMIAADLLSEFANALRSRYGVDIDRQAIERRLGS